MPPPNITRSDLSKQIARGLGISRSEAARLLESFLTEISNCLIKGETVKLSSFGSFQVRHKGQRIGRNPKTGEEATIAPRRTLAFRASQILKRNIADGGANKVKPKKTKDGT